MRLEDLLYENIFDNPLFLIVDEPINAKKKKKKKKKKTIEMGRYWYN